MDIDISAYGLVIGASLVIILSYFSSLIARKTNVPSVLLLIIIGILIKQGLVYIGIDKIPYESLVLEMLGTVGLIFIVLEAALDLELTKDKWPLIWKSFVVALGSLMVSSFAIAWFLYAVVFEDDFMNALVYATPLSIMSSAIIIPSVGGLVHDQKEFMVYDGTFSDVLGIMFFYLLLGNADASGTGEVVGSVLQNISLTLLLSVIVSFGLVFILQRVTGDAKLFLTIAVLLLLYALGKIYHLSPLIMILAFGLMLNNYKLFWKGKLKQFIDNKKMKRLNHDFHVLTLETAFVVRTFFFVFFGISVVLSSLMNWTVIFYSLVICVLLYVVRLLFLFILRRKQIFPLLYIAPRGLITILLYFQIYSAYPEYVHNGFDQGILLFVIMVTSLVMTISLIQNGFGLKAVRRDAETADLDYDGAEKALPPKENPPQELE